MKQQPGESVMINALFKQKGDHCKILSSGECIELKVRVMDTLIPITAADVFDPRTSEARRRLCESIRPEANAADWNFSKLSMTLTFWFAKTVALAVIVFNDSDKIAKLMAAIGALNGVYYIPNECECFGIQNDEVLVQSN